MIALADQKAALAWLDAISIAVESSDAHAILGTIVGACDFYDRLEPEHPLEFEALRAAADAIAAAQYRALRLLGNVP